MTAPLPRPEALLLDLDGTLIDWVGALHAGVDAGAAQLAAAHGLDTSDVAATTLALEAEVYEVHATGWLLGGVGPAELYGALWRRTLDEYGLDPESAAELAAAHWAAELASFRAYDDVTVLRELAAERGIPLALVTNGPSAVQRAKLAQVGLAEAFDAVLISAEVGAAKPDTAIFAAAVAMLDTDPAKVWHIGDSLEFDIAGAQAAGIEGVWIDRAGWRHGKHQPAPDLVIASFTELAALLDTAEAA